MVKPPGTVPFWLVSFLLLFLSGCATHRVDEKTNLLNAEIPNTFSESTSGTLMETWTHSWWESFEDESLSRLIETGLAENLELQQFIARIEQANALAGKAGAQLYPSLDLDSGYDLERDTNNEINNSSDLGLRLRWELDIWGRLSALRRAKTLSTQASVEDWIAARLLLSSAIAETYFEIKERRRQLEVLHGQIKINKSLLKLITLRFGQGQSSIVDVLQQQEQLEETQARVPLTQARIGQLEYSLDVLLGQPPNAIPLVSSTALNPVPPLPVVGIPAQLLNNRPDLRSAQKRVFALDYEVGAAIANQFPALQIGGSINWSGDPGFSNEVAAVFSRLAAPLFNAGELRNDVTFQQAQLSEALAAYSERYLSAIFDVETALLEERKSTEQLVLVEKQLATSKKLLNEARNRFSQGLTDYLPVFTALNIVQNLERSIVSSRHQVLSARIALHRALGGPIINDNNYDIIKISHTTP